MTNAAACVHAADPSHEVAALARESEPVMALDDDFDAAERGGFPFRLIALGYGVGLALSVVLAASGWSYIGAAAAGWFAGVAAIVVVPFARVALDGFLSDVKSRARDKAHREASIEAWDRDLQEERLHARAKGR